MNHQQLKYVLYLTFTMNYKRSDFGKDFIWGAATASYQIEGAWDLDGKSPSIWDVFSSKKGKIKDGSDGKIACDFYHNYPQDISIAKEIGLDAFRFSLAWTRILPNGIGAINHKGLDFYKRVIEQCHLRGIQPWVTLYHWDLPQVLQDKGGWKNRDIISWFSEYVDVCTRHFGEDMKYWMILNEPSVFTTVGYLIGQHAPGEIGWFSFLKASHHVAMAQAEGGRIAKSNVPDGQIGTTFAMTHLMPETDHPNDKRATEKLDALINRLFIDPLMGDGYPIASNGLLKSIERYMKDGDDQKLVFDFDFVGLQNYTRGVIQRKWWVPFIGGMQLPVKNVSKESPTDMGWEVYPEGIYHLLKKLSAYPNMPKIYVTENGAAMPEKVLSDRVEDPLRQQFLERYIAQVLRAKQEGVKVEGYFAWSLLDNFEWAEGYRPRFGIVHVDYDTQKRIIKDSGLWLKNLLQS